MSVCTAPSAVLNDKAIYLSLHVTRALLLFCFGLSVVSALSSWVMKFHSKSETLLPGVL